MRLTKRQRLGLGVLGIGAVALGIDRAFIFSGGQPASASVVVETPDEPQSAPAPPAAAATGPTEPLSDRLRALRDRLQYTPGSLPDAFARPASWTEPAPAREPERVSTSYTLTSVVSNGRTSSALINGRTYRIGQTRDGLTLLGVDDRSALVEVSGRRVRLKLTEPRLDR